MNLHTLSRLNLEKVLCQCQLNFSLSLVSHIPVQSFLTAFCLVGSFHIYSQLWSDWQMGEVQTIHSLRTEPK